jgi:hypothetical protein
MPVSANPAAMNGVRSSSIFTQSPSVSQIRCPTQEDLIVDNLEIASILDAMVIDDEFEAGVYAFDIAELPVL